MNDKFIPQLLNGRCKSFLCCNRFFTNQYFIVSLICRFTFYWDIPAGSSRSFYRERDPDSTVKTDRISNALGRGFLNSG